MSELQDKKRILIVGSGMMVPPLISYLLRRKENLITVASFEQKLLTSIVQEFDSDRISTTVLDVTKQQKELEELTEKHDVVVSYIPWTLHQFVGEACLKTKTHLVTASYENDYFRSKADSIKKNNLIFFNEIGLDPGIDHILIHKVLNEAEQKGSVVTSVESWCGALPAPELAYNPLRYRFSWSPMGSLLASLNSARQLINGKVIKIQGEENLKKITKKEFLPALSLEGYYNRDSIPYKERYGLKYCHTLIRGTLRFSGGSFIIQCFKALGFYDNSLKIDERISNWREYILSSNLLKLNSAKETNKTFVDMLSLKKKFEIYITNSSVTDTKVEREFYFSLAQICLGSFDQEYIDSNGGYRMLFEKAYQALQFLNLYDAENRVNILI